jgi:polynucleotide 5'-kinase involved in rRNA processing
MIIGPTNSGKTSFFYTVTNHIFNF